MKDKYGPLLTDEEFFCRGIDCHTEGLEGLSDAASRADYALCREIFADFVRKSLTPSVLFASLPKENILTADELIEMAALAMRHVMSPCGIPYEFGERVDWFFNPTYNGYREWTWQLSRHAELLTLARAYRETKDARYAEKCCALFDSWVKQATRYSVEENNSEGLCWRSIECGIRMSLVWPEVIHSVLYSEACSADLITDFYKSIYEHALLLRRFHSDRGNWLIMEMSGLLHVGTLCPFFSESGEWLAYATERLAEELRRQVYADGFHFELSSDYQQVLVIHYGRVIRLLRGYGRRVPDGFEETLSRLLHLYVTLMRPNGELPDLNDGSKRRVAVYVSPYADLFPDDAVLQWAASEGKEGQAPEACSTVLPYAGFAVFRTGWREDDTWLCFDGAPFGVDHQHEDKLNVLLHTHGRYVLTEGNNYAYDTSRMRRYVLSTRAHNTALVDGMEQNRRRGYRWSDDMLHEHSGIESLLSDAADAARATYRDGYGEDGDKTVTHERSVYFLKKAEGLSPFALVADRFYAASGEHRYEVQYHLDAERASSEGLTVMARPLCLLASNTGSVTLSLERGVEEPSFNGWTADSVVQGDFRPIYILKYNVCGQNVRFMTLLLPVGEQSCPVVGIEAGADVADTEIVLRLRSGDTLRFDENELLPLKGEKN